MVWLTFVVAWGHVTAGFDDPVVQDLAEGLVTDCLYHLGDLADKRIQAMVWPRQWRNGQRLAARLAMTILAAAPLVPHPCTMYL